MTTAKKPFEPGLYITIFADASYHHETKAFGWCFWIKYGAPATTIVKSGGGVGLPNSVAAEIEALIQGIREVETTIGENVRGKIVVVQSDCTGALSALGEHLARLKSSLGALNAYTKHVRGHQGNATPRNAVNTICDRHAGMQMRKYRGF